MRILRWIIVVVLAGVLVASLAVQMDKPSMPMAPPMSAPAAVTPSATSIAPSAEHVPALSVCQVTELYIPSLRPEAGEYNRWNIRPSKPEWNGDTPLPPRGAEPGDPDPEGAFTDAFTLEWHEAGPDATDQVLIISHSSGWRKLPFNSLMVQGAKGAAASRLKSGALIYLRTACSGDYWLEYAVRPDGIFTSGKPGFQTDLRVVGDGPQPGDLVLLTCLQPDEGKSTEVVAVRGHYTGNIVKF